MFLCSHCSYVSINKDSVKRHMLSHKIQVGNFMKTCGICSKTMRKENFKRHMLTHRSKEVNEEDVNQDPINKNSV